MEWLRDEMTVPTDRLTGPLLGGVVPTIHLRPEAASGRVRVGLWAGDHLMAGWSFPFLPAGSVVAIDGDTITGTVDGDERNLSGFARRFDGAPWPRGVTLPHGTYRLTVDQDPHAAVGILVDVTVTPVEV